MFDDEEIDINLFKTNLVLSLYNFITHYEGTINTFQDIVYEIISIDDIDELLNLDVDLLENDIKLEQIFLKQRINRSRVREDETYKRLERKS